MTTRTKQALELIRSAAVSTVPELARSLGPKIVNARARGTWERLAAIGKCDPPPPMLRKSRVPHSKVARPSLRSREDRDCLVLRNRGLVGHILKRYVSWTNQNQMHEEDLKSFGMLALIRAAELYDESFGLSFSTYACRCIACAMARALWGQFGKPLPGPRSIPMTDFTRPRSGKPGRAEWPDHRMSDQDRVDKQDFLERVRAVVNGLPELDREIVVYFHAMEDESGPLRNIRLSRTIGYSAVLKRYQRIIRGLRVILEKDLVP